MTSYLVLCSECANKLLIFLQIEHEMNFVTVYYFQTVLGDFDTFASAIRSEKTHLLLGLDSSIPGTPEVKDVDFHGRNGIEYPTLVAAKRGSLGNSSSFTGAAKQRPPSLAMPRNTKDAEVLAINSVKN